VRMPIDARDRLILALDFPNDPANPNRLMEAGDAFRLVDAAGPDVRMVKVGWPLYMAGGTPLVRELVARGLGVFLDLKFGDIAETVRRLVEVALREKVRMLTLNADFGAVRAAAQVRGDAPLEILTVTLLTSLTQQDLRDLGVGLTVDEYVMHRARGALAAGSNGVIASGREARALRDELGRAFTIVMPGIRPSGSAADDQRRTATPAEAIAAGADYLVVGRPICKAPSPRDATSAILDEMQRAFDSP